MIKGSTYIFDLGLLFIILTTSSSKSYVGFVESFTPNLQHERHFPPSSQLLKKQSLWWQQQQKRHQDLTASQLGLSSSSATTQQASLPRLSSNDLESLQQDGYLIVEDFIPENVQNALRGDVQNLRSKSEFTIAKIGQDATNTLNTDIRVAETCFIGPSKLSNIPNESRSQLYQILDQLRKDLPEQPLDSNLSEFLYAYYPMGGFYRRHRDAIPGSASVLRKYSLLMYLNENWQEKNGGKLRIHFDSGGDFLPTGENPNYIDVDPKGGTLVLFESDKFPHEVLGTQSERIAIVGWYNRPLSASDIAEISGGEIDPVRLIALAVAAGLVTVGLINLLSG